MIEQLQTLRNGEVNPFYIQEERRIAMEIDYQRQFFETFFYNTPINTMRRNNRNTQEFDERVGAAGNIQYEDIAIGEPTTVVPPPTPPVNPTEDIATELVTITPPVVGNAGLGLNFEQLMEAYLAANRLDGRGATIDAGDNDVPMQPVLRNVPVRQGAREGDYLKNDPDSLIECARKRQKELADENEKNNLR